MSAIGMSPARRRKRVRMQLVIGGVLALGAAVVLTLTALEENIAFFHGPTGVVAGDVGEGVTFRLGGLVKDGSVTQIEDGATHQFIVTDQAEDVTVQFRGLLPDLFREGQGIVALGELNAQKIFIADEVLAKHDETYMPTEAVEAMKRAGTWRHGEDGPESGPKSGSENGSDSNAGYGADQSTGDTQ